MRSLMKIATVKLQRTQRGWKKSRGLDPDIPTYNKRYSKEHVDFTVAAIIWHLNEAIVRSNEGWSLTCPRHIKSNPLGRVGMWRVG